MFMKLAIRNVFRQRLRTLATMVAIVSGVAGLILAGGFVRDIYDQLGEAVIHSQTGHVQIFMRDYLSKGTRQPDKFLIPDAAAVATRVAGEPGVDKVAARLSFAGLLSNGRKDVAIVGEGVEAAKEADIGTYLTIESGRAIGADALFEILVGQGVAQSLSLEVGDTVTVLATTGDGALNSLDFELVGVFQSFSKDYDARAVRIPLQAAQELLLTDGANQIVVLLHRTEDTDRAQRRIEAQVDTGMLEVYNWRTLSDFYDKTVQMYDKQFGVLEWIILLMVLLSVANSVNMSTFERQAELGTMRALGNSPAMIFKLLMSEGLVLGILGATLGAVLGNLIAAIVSAIGIPMPPPPNANVGYTALIRTGLEPTLKAWLIGFAAAFLAAVLPAWRSIRNPIVDALRQGI
ncbi:MAG: ABC transporter permease [Rhodocyclaceae bacterium]|nr:ABC transporter permease [Rhodocyclaceae bacterium]